MKKLVGLFGVVLSALVGAQMVSIPELKAEHWHAKQADRVTQLSTYQSLSDGVYDGFISVAQVRQMADFGIGTLTGLDGEMILLDGVVYHAPSTGNLHVASPWEIVPFATLTRFHAEQRFTQAGALADYPALQSYLSTVLPDQSQVLAIKVQGTFPTLKIRAPQKQSKPYPILTEALKTQAVFDLSNVSGTLVGFRHPSYFGSINASGYHFHFVSDDKRIGGHVLGISTGAITVTAETEEGYDVTFGPAD